MELHVTTLQCMGTVISVIYTATESSSVSGGSMAAQVDPLRPSSPSGASLMRGQYLLVWSPPQRTQKCANLQGVEVQGLPSFQAKQATLLFLGLACATGRGTGVGARWLASEFSTMAWVNKHWLSSKLASSMEE